VGGGPFRGLGIGLRHAGALLDAGDLHPGALTLVLQTPRATDDRQALLRLTGKNGR
jgi:hypothetical protein